MKKICSNCDYYVNEYGYGQCYARRYAPKVDDDYCCVLFKDTTSKGEWERIDQWAGGIYVGGFIHKDCPMIKVSDHCLYSPWKYNFCPNCGADMREVDNDKVN